jgi:hypothetical protein
MKYRREKPGLGREDGRTSSDKASTITVGTKEQKLSV